MLRLEEGREHPGLSPRLPNPWTVGSLRPHPSARPALPDPVPLDEHPPVLWVCVPGDTGSIWAVSCTCIPSRRLSRRLWGLGADGFGPPCDPSHARMGISTTFTPRRLLVSFGEYVVAATWCFGVAQCPGAECSLPRCAIGVTSQPGVQPCLGIKGQAGVPQDRVSPWVGIFMGGESQGLSRQEFGGAGMEDRDLGAPQHPQRCPGTTPQQRGCGRVWGWGLARCSESRRQQSPDPGRASHRSLLGCWEPGTEPGVWGGLGGRGGGSSAQGSQGHGDSSGRKRAGKNKNPQEENLNPPGSDVSPVPRGRRSHRQSPGHCGEAAGGWAGRMRPSGWGRDAASTAEVGLGLAGAHLMPVGTRGHRGQAVWDATAKIHAAASRVTCFSMCFHPFLGVL